MSRRHEQVGSVLQQAIQDFLARGLHDPRVGGLVTVTAVRVSEDFATADVMVSVLPAEREQLAMHGLRHAAGHIRREVGDKVALRQMPRLNFRLDRSLKKEAEVLRALAKAAEVTPPAPPTPPHPPTAPASPTSPTSPISPAAEDAGSAGAASSQTGETGESAAGGGSGDNASLGNSGNGRQEETA